MKCPLCNTEMRIRATEYVQNNGDIFTKQILTCRNKNCPNFDKDVDIVYSSLGTVTEDSNAEVEEAE